MNGRDRLRLPFVSVIIPVRNGEATLRPCLESVLRNDYPAERREVLVVDNGSTDRTAEILRELPVRRLFEPVPGPSNARNRGIREAGGEILAFIDADCVACQGWLRELVSGFETGVGAVAGEILSYPPRTPAERFMAVTHPEWQKRILNTSWPFASTANVAFRRSTLDRIGHFDPRLTSGEDQDIGRRFFDDGTEKFGYRPRAAVFHRNHATARAFFRQQLNWTHGAVLIHAKYDLPWSWWDELKTYGGLLSAASDAAWKCVRNGVGRGEPADFHYAWFHFLRQLARRIGVARWFVRRGKLRARFAAEAPARSRAKAPAPYPADNLAPSRAEAPWRSGADG